MQKYRTSTITINGKKFGALIADSTVKRMIGLMFRKSIGKNQCMLFLFRSEGYYAIWMHNMLFPIDVAWVDEKGTVVDIAQNLKPCTSILGCKEFVPSAQAKYVLEFNEGAAKSAKLKVGSKINLQTAVK